MTWKMGQIFKKQTLDNLGYVDGIMLRMQENVNKQLTPTNI